MPADPKRTLLLADYVSVEGTFARSAHIEWDFYRDAQREYYPTASSRHALEVISRALDLPAERAITLIGPFGAGKSAFCVSLAQLLSGAPSSYLSDDDVPPPIHDLRDAKRRALIPILIVGSRRPLSEALVTGLKHGLANTGRAKLLRWLERRANGVFSEPHPPPRQVVHLYSLAASGAARYGAGGLLLVIDELGKLLEYAAQYPKTSDIFVLQELAEHATRSGNSPLLLIGVLHQSADDYARHLGRTQQAEWVKVSQRFKQLPFFPQGAEQIGLIGRALKQKRVVKLPSSFRELCRQIDATGLVPSSLRGRFVDAARASYPLHPMTLLILPALFQRAAQSHRSLFSFLSGSEPHGLSRFLNETPFDSACPPLFGVDTLFDYAVEVMLGTGGAPAFGRDWADAIEAVEQAADRISDVEMTALKAVALLGVVQDQRLPGSAEVLRLALTQADGSAPAVDAALSSLQDRQLISYSRHSHRYRLWEGGDVDVDGELQAARVGVPAGAATRAALELNPPDRLIARRHSYETGTVRSVNVTTCAGADFDTAIAAAQRDLTVLLCLAASEEDADAAEVKARARRDSNVLVAIGCETDVLQDAAIDLVAADRVRRESRALDSDRAARRHLEARRREAEDAFLREWRRIFGPGGDAVWLHKGKRLEIASPRRFAVLLSKMADETYSAAPILRNELINRHSLSSAAAAGRRNLVERMLTSAAEPALGIEGFPPERSMYECVLRSTGLHRKRKDGTWAFVPPTASDPARLLPAWGALERAVFSDPPGPKPVTELFALLTGFPFGLTVGVLPVILCAFMLVHDQETTLYREGTFVAEPAIADYEVLMRRPEQFAVAGCRVRGERAAVVRRIADGLGTAPAVVPVVRALIGMVRRLPEFAHKTRSLPAHTLAVREAISSARSPERLLFHDLPVALGLSPFSGTAASRRKIDGFFDKLNDALQTWGRATPVMVESARDQLLKACGFETGEAGWKAFREKAVELDGSVVDATLAPFIHRAAMTGEEQAVLESVLALVASRPPRSWSDADVAQFPIQAQVVGALMQDALGLRAHPKVLGLVRPALTPREEGQSRRLANKIAKVLRGTPPRSTPSRVVRAALLSLLDQLGGSPRPDERE